MRPDLDKDVSYSEYVDKLCNTGIETVRLCMNYWVNDQYGSRSKGNYIEWTLKVDFSKGISAGSLMDYLFKAAVHDCRDSSIKVCYYIAFLRHF